MIIEIKDIPQNRNIKKVTFDIEFEDGEPVSNSGGSESYFSENDHRVDPEHTGPTGQQPGITKGPEDSVEGPNITTEGREKKEVPSEMQDITF